MVQGKRNDEFKCLIVGHGSSVLDKDLSGYDFVIGLKNSPVVKPDAIVMTSNMHINKDVECWMFNENSYGQRQPNIKKWMDYFYSFNPSYKPSTGTLAVFCAVEFLGIDTVYLAGFDMLEHGISDKLGEVRNSWVHDVESERKAISGLVTIHFI